jgi:MoaA/NifB/PqqE/SkfB family radical SAM enzyme
VSDQKAVRNLVLEGIVAGRPAMGPQEVHVDVTNGCNARCITCWDHSPLLNTPRSAEWKRQRLPLSTFHELCDELVALGSVSHVVLSGMGEPLTHPDIYDMIARVKREGWRLTLLSNLVAADAERLMECPPDNLLVGVHGASPDAYMAFHPGWTERHFFEMASLLRRLVRAGVQTRHVQVIDSNTVYDVPDMVDLGRSLGAERVNYKLASLADGTESTAITSVQRAWLLDSGIPDARDRSERQKVRTNIDLFERQVRASVERALDTTPMHKVGCYMGYVYTRITVQGEVLYCCNTNVVVGHLGDGPLSEQWVGPRWQAVRERLRSGSYFDGCERCGKFEQNVKWGERVRNLE